MPKLKPPVKAIVFDLDDTLLPEVEYVRSGFRAVASRLARPGYDVDKIFDMLYLQFQNGSRDKVFNNVLLELKQADNPQVIAELVSIYRCHRPVLKLDKKLHEMLKNLQKSYKTGIITDGFLPAQKLKIQALQIEPYFNKIIYTEQLGRAYWKPAPQAFIMMAEALHVSPASCVYIADNPRKDFIAPNQLGWQTVQVNLPQKVHNINPTISPKNDSLTEKTNVSANKAGTSAKNANISIEKADLQIKTPLELINILPC